jgi:iron(III) transport system substrate-binding protein
LFEKVHPDIEVKIVRDSTGIVTAKLLAEKDNPQADLVWGTAATSLMLCDQAGMVEPYAPKGLEKVVGKMRDANNPPHWVGIKAWMTGFCVNTIEVEQLKLPIPESMARSDQTGIQRAADHAQPGVFRYRFLDRFRCSSDHGRRKRLAVLG